MLKGHVFSEQLFKSQIFALFINTFLEGKNGVSNNYKNAMAVTYSGSNVTIGSGAVCIQGRFLEEDNTTTLSAGTDTMYCKLVIEIDLDKTNTASDFQQACYKIVKSAGGYPNLTQTNIVKNNAGVYQYELARFKTSSNGITDFEDKRTFLDFESIYSAMQTEYRSILEDLEEELQEARDESLYALKSDEFFANNTGSIQFKTSAEELGFIGYTDQSKLLKFTIPLSKKTNSMLTTMNTTFTIDKFEAKLINISDGVAVNYGNTINFLSSGYASITCVINDNLLRLSISLQDKSVLGAYKTYCLSPKRATVGSYYPIDISFEPRS